MRRIPQRLLGQGLVVRVRLLPPQASRSLQVITAMTCSAQLDRTWLLLCTATEIRDAIRRYQELQHILDMSQWLPADRKTGGASEASRHTAIPTEVLS